MCRTVFLAHTAVDAFFIINASKVVFNLDCTLGTIFLTFHTSYTAVGANLAHLGAFVVAGAFNNNAGGVVDKVDNMIGTGFGAKSAADTFSGVDFGNSLFLADGYGITGTYIYAIAVAEAGEGTVAVTRKGHICRYAGFNSVINVLSFRGKTGAVAGYVGNLLYNVTCCKTHNFTDTAGDTVAAGDTKAGVIGFTL